jgi:hypothetical protein
MIQKRFGSELQLLIFAARFEINASLVKRKSEKKAGKQ